MEDSRAKGWSQLSIYIFLYNPHFWYSVFKDVLVSSWPDSQRPSVLSSPENKILGFCPGSRRGHMSRGSASPSYFSPFLFIPTFRDACQSLGLLRMSQGKFGWFSAFCTVSLGFSVFRAAKSPVCFPVSKVVLLLLPFLFFPSLWIYALKKSLCCALGGVSGGSKIGCMYFIHSLSLQPTPARTCSPIPSADTAQAKFPSDLWLLKLMYLFLVFILQCQHLTELIIPFLKCI